MNFFKLYLAALAVFFLIDLFWLGVIAKNLYREQIGILMADKIRWTPAILFYLIYMAGLVHFAILPGLKESSWQLTLFYGSFFGFVCYATYDLTNLATLKDWPVKIVIYDLLWGAFISGVTSLIIFSIGINWKNTFN